MFLIKLNSDFCLQKRTQGKVAKGSTYTPPEIYKTEDYFVKPDSTKGDNSVKTDTKTEVVTESKSESVNESW